MKVDVGPIKYQDRREMCDCRTRDRERVMFIRRYHLNQDFL